MMDILFALKPHFTDADKEACKPVIARMVELVQFARTQGLLALEVEADREENLFLKMAMRFVADALGPEEIKQVLQNSILAGDYSGTELLSRLIIIEGCLSLQSCDSPQTTREKLTAMLGETYYAEMLIARKEEEEAKDARRLQSFLEMKDDTDSKSEIQPLELLLYRMPKVSVQKVLDAVDAKDLVVALKGSENSLFRIVFQNVPSDRCNVIFSDVNYLHNVRLIDVERASNNIINKIFCLEKSGEISLR